MQKKLAEKLFGSRVGDKVKMILGALQNVERKNTIFVVAKMS